MNSKILALVLSLMMLFSSVPAEAAADVAEAEETLSCSIADYILGFNLSGEDAVSRITFAQAIGRSLGVDPAGASVPFEDISPDDDAASSVSTLLALGAISSGTSFRPNEAITRSEASKIAVAALGYGLVAETKGGYPTGYVSVADSLDLWDGTGTSENITSSQMKTFIYNFLNCEIMEQTAFGSEEQYSVTEDNTVLYAYHDIELAEGIVNATDITYLGVESDSSGEGMCSVGGVAYSVTDEAAAMVRQLLGYNVNAYYRQKGSTRTLVAVDPVDNKTISFIGEDAVIDGNQITVQSESGKEKRYRLDIYDVVYNEKFVYKDTAKLMSSPSARFTLIDNDDDGLYEIVDLDQYKYMVVGSTNEIYKTIVDQNADGDMIDLSPSDCIWSIADLAEGKNIAIGEIGTSSVIAYKESVDRLYYEIYKCSYYEEAVAEEYNSNTEAFVLNGVSHKVTDYFKKNYIDSVTLGDTGDFYFGPDGEIVAYFGNEGKIMYGFLIAYDKSNGLGAPKVKIFDEKGNIEIYTLPAKVLVDGKRKSTADKDEFLAILDTVKQKSLIRFLADANNELTMLDLPAEATGIGDMSADPVDDALRHYAFSADDTYVWHYRGNVMQTGNGSFVPGGTIFCIPADINDEESYKITNNTTTAFGGNAYTKTVTTQAYDVSAAGVAGAMLYMGANTNPTVPTDSSRYSFMVEKFTEVIYEDEPHRKVSGWISGGFYEFVIDNNVRILKDSGKENLYPGDIIAYSRNSKGLIEALTIEYDNETKGFESVAMRNNAIDANVMQYHSGKVYSTGSGSVVVALEGSEPGTYDFSWQNLRAFPLDGASIVIFDETTGHMRPGNMSDIMTYLGSGESEADRVIIRQNYLKIKSIFVYKQ